MTKIERKFWAAVATIIYGGMIIGTVLLWLGAYICAQVEP